MTSAKVGTVSKSAKRPQPKGGSRKGVPNKINADIKSMILTALGNAGGATYLEERANDPRTAAAFLGLVGKVLPMTIAGDPNTPLRMVTRVELVPMRGNSAD